MTPDDTARLQEAEAWKKHAEKHEAWAETYRMHGRDAGHAMRPVKERLGPPPLTPAQARAEHAQLRAARKAERQRRKAARR